MALTLGVVGGDRLMQSWPFGSTRWARSIAAERQFVTLARARSGLRRSKHLPGPTGGSVPLQVTRTTLHDFAEIMLIGVMKPACRRSR